jgi:uncharacterized membrane protein/thiol-disulfide isomerase/thioredoxin
MSEQDNAIVVVQRLIRHHNIPVSNQTIEEDLKSHQDYPSLKSICDALNDWKVANYPMRLDRNELKETGVPFIAHLNDHKEKLAFVPKLNGNSKIIYFDSAGKGKVINENEFFDKYSGVSILIEPDEKSGEKEYEQKTQEQFLHLTLPYLVGLSFMFLAAYTIVSNENQLQITAKNIAILFTKVTGLFLSALLVLKDLNINNSLADRLCGLSKKINCNSILNTEAAKVFGWIHWSDVGLIYFLSGMLMVISIPSVSDYNLMAIGSFCALFYVFYSIYYQGLVAKTWCPLCLGIQVIFIAEVALSYNYIWPIQVSWMSVFKFGSITMITIFVMVLFKAYYISKQTAKNEHLKYLRFKRNPYVYISQLNQNEHRQFDVSEEIFTVSNGEFGVMVTAFLSLNCNPCRKTFHQLKELFEREEVTIQMILSFHKKNIGLVNHLARLFREKNQNKAMSLLEVWYNGKESKLPGEVYNEQYADDYERINKVHQQFFKNSEVSGTPTIFVNGYKLPIEYEVKDLAYFIDVLKQKCPVL